MFPLFDMAMHRLSQKYGKPLPYYFSMDVNAMDLPLVCIYLDTYEKMVSRAEGAGDSTGFTQEWLRGASGLLPNLGNAVFAIAGKGSFILSVRGCMRPLRNSWGRCTLLH